MNELGHTIRQRRIALGLALEALAKRTGVSRAMLSDIERGVKNPTIKVLSQIAEGLGCTVSYLLGEQLGDPGESIHILRKHERRVLVDPQSGVERQVLAPVLQRHGIEVVWYVIPPGQKTGSFPPHQHGVEEHITLVQGRLECTLGDRNIVLETEDSVSFPADVTHDFSNPGPLPCQYFLIIDSSHKDEPLTFLHGYPQW